MKSVGIREFKARLSEYLRSVKEGEALLITDRGRPVARVLPEPADASSRFEFLRTKGIGTWSGKMPLIERPKAKWKKGPTLADLVLEDRGK